MLETVLGPLWAFLAFPETQRPSLTTLISGGVLLLTLVMNSAAALARANSEVALASPRVTPAARGAAGAHTTDGDYVELVDYDPPQLSI